MIDRLKLKANFFKILVFCSVIVLTTIGPLLGVSWIVTYGILPFIAVYCFLNYGLKYSSKQIEFSGQLLLTVSAVISTSFAFNIDFALEGLIKIIGVLIVSFVAFELNPRFGIFANVLKAYIVSILLLISYELISGTISPFGIVVNYDRDRFLLNANMYSYLIFFANISFLFLYEKSKKNIIFVLYALSQYLFLITVFSTASRSGLLFILLVNAGYWILINKSKYSIINILKYIVFLIIGWFIYKIYFLNSFLSERSNSSSDIYDHTRKQLLNESIETFLNSPFFGVGPGNFVLFSGNGSYSHISFLEVSVNQGILGFLGLFIIFFIPIRDFIKRKMWTTSNGYKVYILFLLLFLLYNFFYPFYLYLDLMFFFFVVVSEFNSKFYFNLK